MRVRDWAGRLGSALVVYPVLLSVAYVLDLAFAHNLPFTAFIRPMLVAAAFAAILTLAVSAALRDRHVGGLVALAVLLALASREPLRQAVVMLNQWVGVGQAVVVFALIAAAALSVAAVVLVKLRRSGRTWAPRATPALNFVSAILLVLVTGPALGFYFDARPDLEPLEPVAAAPGLPDIYLIVLDGHPRSDVLLDTFDFDDSAFLANLGNRGFSVAQDSHSNYTYTSLTLSSILSLDYLEAAKAGDAVVSQQELRQSFRWLTRNGDLPRTLRAAGYSIVATDAGWEHVSLRNIADRFLAGSELTEMEAGLLLQTWIPDLPLVPHDWLLSARRDVVRRTFADALGLPLSDDGPSFALVHVPSPHMPIAFGRDGGPVPWGSRELYAGTPREYRMTRDEYNAAYGDQLNYLHGRVLELVDAILASPREAVVVLMSDHGTSPDDSTDLRTLLPNLVAVLAPGEAVPDEDMATPLNAMRYVFRRHVGVPLDPLEPRFWVAREDQGRIYISEAAPLR